MSFRMKQGRLRADSENILPRAHSVPELMDLLQRNVGASHLIKWPVMEDLVVPHNGCMQMIDSRGRQHGEPLGGCTFLSNSAIVFA